MKKFIKVLAILTLIFGNLYFGFKLYIAGDQEEKTKLLTATMWKLTEEGYKKDDIDFINNIYNPFKGKYPYYISIRLKEQGKGSLWYIWTKDKKDVIELDEYIGSKR